MQSVRRTCCGFTQPKGLPWQGQLHQDFIEGPWVKTKVKHCAQLVRLRHHRPRCREVIDVSTVRGCCLPSHTKNPSLLYSGFEHPGSLYIAFHDLPSPNADPSVCVYTWNGGSSWFCMEGHTLVWGRARRRFLPLLFYPSNSTAARLGHISGLMVTDLPSSQPPVRGLARTAPQNPTPLKWTPSKGLRGARPGRVHSSRQPPPPLHPPSPRGGR